MERGFFLPPVARGVARFSSVGTIPIKGGLVSAFRFRAGLRPQGLVSYGESGIFLGGSSDSRFFPKKERSFATGILNPVSNVGAFLHPLLFPGLLGMGMAKRIFNYRYHWIFRDVVWDMVYKQTCPSKNDIRLVNWNTLIVIALILLQ